MVNAFQNNQFSNAAVTGFQSGQANFGLSNEATYQAQTAGIPAAFGGGAQAVFQPGFAGTDVQQVRNQIARDGGYGYTGAQQSFAQTAGNAGVPASFGGGAQAIFQPGFAGTDAQQVRNDIARDIGFGVQPNFANAGFGQSVGTAGIPAAFGGGAQAIFQPGFAGTDVQQVRNQIARDGGYGYGGFQQSFGQTAGVPASFGGGAQAVFQPGFAGTDVQQVRNQIARDGGYGYGGFQQGFNQSVGTAGVPASFGGGAQAVFQPGFAGTDVQQVRNQIARDGGYNYSGFQQNVGQTVGVPASFGGGAQAVFQPGFAGTDVQQVRNQIARDGGYGYGGFQQGFGQTAGVPASFGGGAQAVFQPGFAGTDAQQVRNQISQ